ncbi:DctA-YdbH Dicarboxylate transport [Salmonella enterica subsp. arizonae]|nr:DctA-YdbH Dicarboxylate transport [Salmonella enterica subsp. arizonae]
MTLRIDKNTADAVVKDNVTAGSAINWLRYMEITHSWTKINVDNLGVLTMQAALPAKAAWMVKPRSLI